MHKEANQTVETPVEARGGFLDRPVFVVLAVSLVLAVVAMALSYAGFFRQLKATATARHLRCGSSLSLNADFLDDLRQ